MNATPTLPPDEVPVGDLAGFRRHLRADLTSGFLVFLIALPLCLGISIASGFPPVAGIFTAIVGAVLGTLLSDSELTIKGPAAGLIVIVLGCVTDFGGGVPGVGVQAANVDAYRAALAVGFAAAALQVVFGLVRAGILGEFFPSSAVHGMLAAIGVIIMLKQVPVALGVKASGEPLELLQELPHLVLEANPAIATIGVVSLLLMFLWPWAGRRWPLLRRLPAPLVVLLVAVPMGSAFDLLHEHSYALQGHEYQLGEQYLVTMPDRVGGMFDELTLPAFGALGTLKAWKWVFLFFMIGSLESLLSAKAVDLLDPWKRRSSLDRDMVAVGVGNLASSMVGGLPMISEIVRSKANIDNGARTRYANLWHGVFLLLCVALIPTVLHRIPLAALAAMLVYTGFRLAHPTEFVSMYRLGREQLLIFVVTLVAVLATDLLVGIGIGILLKMVIHVSNGVPLRSLFKPYLEVEPLADGSCLVRAKQSAVFSNWIPFKRQIGDLGLIRRQDVTIDLSETELVDASVMEKLHELQGEFEQEGLTLTITGLDAHEPLAPHEHSARRRRPPRLSRITFLVDPGQAEPVSRALSAAGALEHLTLPCRLVDGDGSGARDLVRFELVLGREPADRALEVLDSTDVGAHARGLRVELVELARGG